MAVTIALALSAAALWGTTDFLGGLTARQLRALTVVLWVNAVGLVASLAVVLATGAGISGAGIAWGAAAGFISAVGFASFYAALAAGSMSIVAPITASGAIVPAVVAIAGGADVAAHVAAGMALALGGAILAARAPAVDEPSRLSARVLGLAVIAALAIGGTLTMLQQATDASGTDPLSAVAASRAFGLIVIGLFVALARAPASVPKANMRAVALVGLGDTGANVLFVLASDAGNDAVAAVFSSLYPITTVLLARSLLHERISRAQAVGVAIALAGVALVSAG